MAHCTLKSDLAAKKCRPFHICQNRSGFTLVEIIVVVAVVAVLSALAVGYYNDYLEDAKVATSATNMRLLNDAIARCYKDNMAYPKYLELDSLLMLYMNRPLSEIIKEALEVSSLQKNNLYYQVFLAPKKGDNYDLLSSPRAWLTEQEIESSGKKDSYMVSEIAVSASRP